MSKIFRPLKTGYYSRMSFIFFILVTLANSFVFSQETKVWTLDECIRYAIDHNIDLKKQSLNMDLQEQTLLQSKLDLLPTLNGGATHGYNWGKRVDLYTNDFATNRVRSNNFYASSDITLFGGLQKYNTIKQNQLNLLSTKYDIDAFLDNISVSVATYYLQVLYNVELEEMARNQLNVTMQQVERTKKLVEAGTLAQGDLLIVEAQKAAEELSLVQAENNVALSYLYLSQLLELPSPEGFRIEKPVIDLIPETGTIPKSEEIFAVAVKNRPEIKSAELRTESSFRSLRIAQGYMSPRLTLNGSIGTGYSGANKTGENRFSYYPPIGISTAGDTVFSLSPFSEYTSYTTKPFGDQLDDNINKSLGFSLSIPIFNGWQVRNGISQAKIMMEQSKYDLELQKNELHKTVQQVYNDAVSAHNQHKAAIRKVDAMSESFKYSEQKYNVGMLTSVEYNNAKKELNNAQSELLQAKYNFVFKSTILDFYLGKPITLKK